MFSSTNSSSSSSFSTPPQSSSTSSSSESSLDARISKLKPERPPLPEGSSCLGTSIHSKLCKQLIDLKIFENTNEHVEKARKEIDRVDNGRPACNEYILYNIFTAALLKCPKSSNNTQPSFFHNALIYNFGKAGFPLGIFEELNNNEVVTKSRKIIEGILDYTTYTQLKIEPFKYMSIPWYLLLLSKQINIFRILNPDFDPEIHEIREMSLEEDDYVRYNFIEFPDEYMTHFLNTNHAKTMFTRLIFLCAPDGSDKERRAKKAECIIAIDHDKSTALVLMHNHRLNKSQLTYFNYGSELANLQGAWTPDTNKSSLETEPLTHYEEILNRFLDTIEKGDRIRAEFNIIPEIKPVTDHHPIADLILSYLSLPLNSLPLNSRFIQ